MGETPKTATHILFNFTTAATILKLMETPYKQILPISFSTLLVDTLIDLGHRGGGRSAATHSIATAPVTALISYILIEYFLKLVNLNSLGLVDSNLLLLILTYSSLTHLFWDSLTYQGIHVPLIGWVSLSDVESQGALANIPPVASSIICILFFWARSV